MSPQDKQASAAATSNNRAKVFVSYSRKDSAFAQMLVEALTARGFDAFLDQTDIAPGEPWKERLAGLIAAADTVVFIVSPDSIASTICAWELEESARLGKRTIPVVARPTVDADAPPTLGRLNWIFLTEPERKDAALATLDAALRTDLTWVREHTRLGELARHWHEGGRKNSATLRGTDLDAAERWLDRRPAEGNASTDLHQDFIRGSRRAATARQRYWVSGSLTIALIAIALAVFAEISRRDAQTQRERAEHTLTLATETANSLVFKLAQKFRNVIGVPKATIEAILDQARKLQEQLLTSGESSPDLRRSQGVALGEISATLLVLRDTQSALDAAQQALRIFQQLAADNPGDTDFQHNLAISNNRVGEVLVVQGNLSEALKYFETSQRIVEAVLAQQPDNIEFQHQLMYSYDEIGPVKFTQGDLAGALASYQSGLAIIERLAKSDPGNTLYQRELSVSYNKIGEVLEAQGNLLDALTSYQLELAIAVALAKSDPSNAIWQRDVAVSYQRIGGVQMAQGNLPAALTSYKASQDIFDRLAKSDRGNTDWQEAVAASYEKIGDVQLAEGDLPDALTSYQASLAVRERLANADPNNTDWQRSLSVSYWKVGDVQQAQGDLAAALSSYQVSLAIAERLAQSDPSNRGWQRDLSLVYVRVGDVQLKQGDLTAALASYQAGLVIRLSLTKSDPTNLGWLRDLSVAYIKLGNAQLRQGNPTDALTSYLSSLVIRDGLTKSNPGNAGWQRDLANSNEQVGIALFALNRVEESLSYFKVAVQLNPTYPYHAIWLHIARSRAGQNDMEEFAENAKRIDRLKWPWPIVALFLGSMTPDQTQQAAESAEQLSTRVAQSCEADFFIGIYLIERSNKADARPLLQSAVDQCPKNFIEYPVAELELKRLDEIPGAQAK